MRAFEVQGAKKGTILATFSKKFATLESIENTGFTGNYGYFGREFKPRSFHHAVFGALKP